MVRGRKTGQSLQINAGPVSLSKAAVRAAHIYLFTRHGCSSWPGLSQGNVGGMSPKDESRVGLQRWDRDAFRPPQALMQPPKSSRRLAQTLRLLQRKDGEHVGLRCHRLFQAWAAPGPGGCTWDAEEQMTAMPSRGWAAGPPCSSVGTGILRAGSGLQASPRRHPRGQMDIGCLGTGLGV